MLNAHPGLPKFDYIRPETLAQASQFLAANFGQARPLLGGTDIFVRMRDGDWKDSYLVDVKGLEGMNDIIYHPERGLSIGAAVNMNRVIASPQVGAHYPLLAQAAQSVASYPLRSRATIVGNICNASPAGDTIGACMLLDGVLGVHGVGGMRQEPLHSFFIGPGETALKPGDIVASVHLPPPPEGMAGEYIKLGRNRASDLSIVGVTALGYPDQAVASGYRIKLALASVAPTPLVVEGVEQRLADGPITDDSLAEAAQIAMDACTPIDDVRASARYRKLMARNLSLLALKMVWDALMGQDG
jgi:carbon-monoxide dehydrogenase medium subunit